MGRTKKSAGVLLFRQSNGTLEVLLVHPGGPFWAKQDEQAWSIPKGEFEDTEDPWETAKREFTEETGGTFTGEPIPLHPLKQPSGKIIYAWAVDSDFDLAKFKSNNFSMEWPPKSGQMQEFPEIDRAEWFTLNIARHKLLRGQVNFIDQLVTIIDNSARSMARTGLRGI